MFASASYGAMYILKSRCAMGYFHNYYTPTPTMKIHKSELNIS